jgi:hypothetical protein
MNNDNDEQHLIDQPSTCGACKIMKHTLIVVAVIAAAYFVYKKFIAA